MVFMRDILKDTIGIPSRCLQAQNLKVVDLSRETDSYWHLRSCVGSEEGEYVFPSLVMAFSCWEGKGGYCLLSGYLSMVSLKIPLDKFHL